MLHALTDEQLLFGYAESGSHDLFAELVRRHMRSLVCWLYTKVRHWETAADLAQDTFCRIHEKAHQFAGRASAKTWIFMIGWRIAVSHRRRPGFRRELQTLWDGAGDVKNGAWEYIDTPLTLQPDPHRKPDDEAAFQEELRMLNGALSNSRTGGVLEMTDLYGLSYDEAAERLGVPIGTIRSRRHRELDFIKQAVVKPDCTLSGGRK